MFELRFLCFFFYFSSILIIPTFSYTLPDHYFVNCGSGSSSQLYGRTFVGDENNGGVSLSSGDHHTAVDTSSSSVELYQSARVFRKQSWYEFNIDQNGTFVVRFHFRPFPSTGNVSDARFSVLASGFSLLSQFTVENFDLLPRVEEFFITISPGKFRVKFVPDGGNYFAFVNAIEVFVAPREFIRDSAPHVTPEGQMGDNYKNLLSFPFRVIHRINVGGKNIMPNNDTLLRSWIPDDPYLFNKETAKDSVTYGFRPKYQNPGATEFDAPEFVYTTAKQLNIADNNNSSGYNLFNITWRFRVKARAMHLVRVHFCDIVSVNSNFGLQFNSYVFSQFRETISPYSVIPQLAAPFYKDYLVDADDLGFINVSVGAKSDSRDRNAFLNGVEIMQLINDTAVSGGGGTHLYIIIGSVVGSTIVVVMILILVLYLKRRKVKAIEAFDPPLVPLYGGSSYTRTTDKTVAASPLADLNLGLKLHLSEIRYATKNFHKKRMIGEGGFGKVYKGTLMNGTKVAVKRSDQHGSGQGLPEFETEIMVLSRIRHNHLVSLVGYCHEGDEMILVYEFMEKGTLRDHLYKVDSGEKSIPGSTLLSWDQRVRICIGAAKGIVYLHTGSSEVIIHRDIKSTNILLDEQFVAKVADFGLSRSGPPDQTHVSTEVKGSFGYLDPEYFKCLQLTTKSDVYSFGVVLLEVLCARPVVDQNSRNQVSFVDWGMSYIKKGQVEQIVDPLLEGKINPDSLRKFGETVEKCLQELGTDRPNMVDVLWDLEYCLKVHETVTPRVPYEDSTTDMGLPMQVIQRLPSHSLPSDEDESYSFTNASQATGEVFSMLKIDEAR